MIKIIECQFNKEISKNCLISFSYLSFFFRLKDDRILHGSDRFSYKV